MWDGRGDARELVDVPARTTTMSYPLVPRWPYWLALLPLLGLLTVGTLVVVFSGGAIDVVKAPVVPRTPVLTLPTSAPTTLAGSPITLPSPPPPIAERGGSNPGTTELTPRQPEDPSVAALPVVSTSTTASTTTTTSRPDSPPTPRTRADCMGGGWRELVDDEGRPFPNQGQCIQFVERRGA